MMKPHNADECEARLLGSDLTVIGASARSGGSSPIILDPLPDTRRKAQELLHPLPKDKIVLSTIPFPS